MAGRDRTFRRGTGPRTVEQGRPAEPEHREVLREGLVEASSDMPFGRLRGKIRRAADFDRTPNDLIDAMESGNL
jgi:hypothetical protein